MRALLILIGIFSFAVAYGTCEDHNKDGKVACEKDEACHWCKADKGMEAQCLSARKNCP